MENQIVKSNSLDLFNPQAMEAAKSACEMFTSSNLVPEMYREGGIISKGTGRDGKEISVTKAQAQANVFIALDIASRINASPLMVMQNLYVVQGKPSWSSSFLIASVNTCGRFKPLKFYISQEGEVETKDHQRIPNLTCIAYTCEKGIAPEDEKKNNLTSSKISIQMAISEGWFEKFGSKWKTMPEQMLRYRAASFWVRTYAPEIAMGMYTVEENEDIIDIKSEDVILENANQGVKISFDNIPSEDNNQSDAQDEPQQTIETKAEEVITKTRGWREKQKEVVNKEEKPIF